jgi:hypothetical protein
VAKIKRRIDILGGQVLREQVSLADTETEMTIIQNGVKDTGCRSLALNWLKTGFNAAILPIGQ